MKPYSKQIDSVVNVYVGLVWVKKCHVTFLSMCTFSQANPLASSLTAPICKLLFLFSARDIAVHVVIQVKVARSYLCTDASVIYLSRAF